MARFPYPVMERLGGEHGIPVVVKALDRAGPSLIGRQRVYSAATADIEEAAAFQ